MKKNLKKLAIIILNYNNANLCIKLVEKLLLLDTQAQIFVVDNCSSDDSRIALNQKLPRSSCIHKVFLKCNTGYAKGNNEGVKYALKICPEINAILIMNPDIDVNADTLFSLYEAVLLNDKIGAVTAQTIYNGVIRYPNDCAWKFLTKSYMMFGGTLIGRLFAKSLKYHVLEPDEHGLAYVDVVQGCCFMIRRDVFENVGMFDTHTFLYSEESILAKRLESKGYKNAVLTNCFINHNHKEKNKRLQNNKNKLFDMQCYYNSRRYYINNYSGCGWLFVRACNAFLSIDFGIKRIIRKIPV